MTTTHPRRHRLVKALALALAVLFVIPLTAGDADARRKKRRKKKRGKKVAYLTTLEQQLYDELIKLRKAPRKYAEERLAPMRQAYEGKHFKLAERNVLITNDGVAALDSALADLRGGKKRLRKLKLSKGMTLAARDHVLDIGKTGSTDHAGADGNTAGARLSRYGAWEHRNAELLSFGWGTAPEVLAWLLIDDGVPGYGHRKQLLGDRWKQVGLACGKHTEHEHVCVVVLAQKFKGAKKKVKVRANQLQVYVTE